MLSIRHKQKDFFLKILKSIVLLSVVTLLLSATVFYYYFRVSTQNQLYTFNNELLERTSKEVENTNENITHYVQSIFQNIAAERLMFSSEEDIYDLVGDIDAMKKVYASNPWVHSIYLYNSRLDKFYIIGEESLIRIGGIADKQAKLLLVDDDYPSNYPIARKIPHSEGRLEEIINVYSYLLKSPNDEGTLPDAVIVNIYSEALFSAPISNGGDPSEIIGVFSIDSAGKVVGSANENLFLNNIHDRSFVDRITTHTANSGYFVDRTGGERKLISYVRNDSLAWTFVSRMPHSQIDTYLNKIIYASIVIFIIIVGVSIIFSYFVSKSIYAPIDKLKTAVKDNNFTSTPDFKSIAELKSIADHYQLMHHELENLEDYKRRSFQYEKNRVIRNLIFKVSPSKEALLTLFKEYEISLDFQEPAILYILKIDNYDQDYEKRLNINDQQLFKFTLKTTSQKLLLQKSLQCEVVESEEDTLAIIISLRKDQYNYQRMLATIKECIMNTRIEMSMLWNVGFSGYISKITENLFNIGEAYNDVIELSKQRMVFGHGCILAVKDSEEDVDGSAGSIMQHSYIDPSLEEKIEQLLEVLKTGNKDKVFETYENIVSVMKENNYDMIMYIVLYINSLIMNTVILMERNSNIEFNVDFLKINKDLSNCETLAEISKIFKNTFKEIIATLDHQKQNRHEDFIQRINDYIDKNYMFETLSSTEISEKFGLSQSYLNRIYRKACYMSISNYIKQIRLEKAAELILETDYSIDRILERIGWVTKEYFYSSFKKQFGVTPGDYKYKGTSKN